MASFWQELRRRNVFRVGIAYLAAVWVLIQVADVVLPNLGSPAWIMQALIFSAALGFPLALLLAWFYELTPTGIKTASEAEAQGGARFSGRKLDFAIIALLVLAVGFLLVDSAEEQPHVLTNSVAVLPFENLSPNPEDAYFAAGIHEEILNRLAKLSDLNVIARTSVMQYAEAPPAIPVIAEELGVELIMEGSVRYAGNSVRIAAQLIDASDNTHLWSEIYERDLSDIFEIQADIGGAIASALEAELLPAERETLAASSTNSPEAYALFLRATQEQDNARRARIAFYDAAIAVDPDFALAYGHRALEYAELTRFPAGPLVPSDVERLARENAATALALDPTIAVAHAALALIHEGHWQVAEAEAEYEQALRLRPNDTDVLLSYSALKRAVGDHQDAIQLNLRAVDLDPRRMGAHHFLGHSYFYAGDIENAALAYEAGLRIGPNAQGPLTMVALMDTIRGENNEAVRKLRQVEERPFVGTWQLPRLAYVYAQAGRPDEARRIFEQLLQREEEGSVTPVTWAFAHFALGEYEPMLVRLREAIEDNVPGDFVLINELKGNVFRDPVLENDPRFVDARSQLSLDLITGR